MENLPEKHNPMLPQQITKENWLTVWQELPVRANLSISEVRETYKTDSLAVIFVNGEKNKENAYTVLEALLVGLFEFYGASYRPQSIRELAVMIYDQYYWLDFSELKHFFLRAKNGEYSGKSFAELKPQFVMQWIAQYAEESLSAREAASIAKHERYKYADERERNVSATGERKAQEKSFHDALKEQYKRENE